MKTAKNDLLIDYLEGELEGERPELNQEDLKLLRSLEYARAATQKTGMDLKIPSEEDYFDRLHDKIMKKIEEEAIPQSPKGGRMRWPVAAAAVFALIGSAWIAMQSVKPAGVREPMAQVERGMDKLVTASLTDTQALQDSLILDGLGQDVVFDSGIAQLGELTREQYKALLN